MDYFEFYGREPTEKEFVQMITTIEPQISHTGKLCPGETSMLFIVLEGLRKFPESEILAQIRSTSSDGRSCPSSEMHYHATKWLEEENAKTTNV